MLRNSKLAVVLAVPILLYIVYPLGALLSESVTLPVAEFRARQMGWEPGAQPAAAGLRRVFSETKTRAAIWGTLKLSALSALTAGACGLALALLWTRRDFPQRRLFAALGYAPLLMPPIVGTLAFQALVGETGQLWPIFPFLKKSIGPFERVLLVHTYSFGCFTYAYVSAALEDADRALDEAARSLGAKRLKTFFAATWPVIRAPLLAAALLTFMSSAASFSAPYMLDNSGRYLTVEIFNERGDPGLQRALSVLLAALALTVLPAFLYFMKRSAGAQTLGAGIKGHARRGLPPAGKRASQIRLALSILAAVPLLLPLASAFSAAGSASENGTQPGAFTAIANLTSEDWSALGRSVGYGAGVAAIDVSLAVLIALALKKSKTLAALPVEFGIMLALALPGSAVAVALLSAFNGPSPLFLGAALGGTSAILILAYVVRTLAYAVRPARAAYDAVSEELLDAARSLGAKRARVIFKVILPMLYPALLAGALICFITAAGEYVASMLLFSPETLPVSVRIDQVSRTDMRSAYALALCLMVTCAALGLAARVIGRERRMG